MCVYVGGVGGGGGEQVRKKWVYTSDTDRGVSTPPGQPQLAHSLERAFGTCLPCPAPN